jgi:CheY-like chemotaxis protein
MLGLIRISISKGAVLKTDLAKDLPAVLGNGPQIQQVVMNLVLNASDALGGKGGEITVSTSVSPRGDVSISDPAINSREGNYVKLEVSDTGPGITREAQARIFEPFFTTKFAGRGLGLAVVQGIVRAHKGEIELASAPGSGTTFKVFWPSSNQPPEAFRAAVPAVVSTRNTCVHGTVLVVEDEVVLRLSISKILRKEGFTVIEAGDGSAAIDLLSDLNRQIDVILLDMTLPGTPSGTVVTEAGRLRPGVKVLLTSAYCREMAGQASEVTQIHGFIRKPFRLHDLVDLLRKTVSG